MEANFDMRAFLRFVVTVTWDGLVCAISSRQKADLRSDNRKRLLIVRVDAIGDFILWLQGFETLRMRYPQEEWRITLLGNAVWRDLAEPLPFADEYWFVDVDRFRRDLKYRARWLFRVRRGQFDRVIQPTYSRRALTGDALAGRSAAPERIASMGDLANSTRLERSSTNRLFTRLVEAATEPLHEIDRNAEFLRNLLSEPVMAELPDCIRSHCLRFGRPPPAVNGRKYFVIAPGGGDPLRQWPPDNFASVARRMFDQTGWHPVILGSAAERHIAEQIMRHDERLPWKNLIGDTTLIEAAAILDNAELAICIESGLAHIAVSVRTSVLVLLGGGHFGRFFPYPERFPAATRVLFSEMPCFGCNWNCSLLAGGEKVYPCMKGITIDRVVEELKSCLV